jgi:segregation and condensation protein A
VDLYQILKAYRRVLQRAEEAARKETSHQIVPFPYELETQKERILSRLPSVGQLSFEELIQEDYNRIALVFNFLAILELLAANQISIRVGEGFNNFWISAGKAPEASMSQTAEL